MYSPSCGVNLLAGGAAVCALRRWQSGEKKRKRDIATQAADSFRYPICPKIPLLRQLLVLRLGLSIDRNVGVGMVPEVEEVLVSTFRFSGVALRGKGAA